MIKNIVFILVSKKFIEAGFYSNEKITPISVRGNRKIFSNSNESCEMLIKSIKETFNISELNDIVLSIYILNCDANREISNCLYNQIKKAAVHIVVKIKHVLPYLCILKKALKIQSELYVSILESKYLVKINSDEKYNCFPLKNIKSKKIINIELEDLLLLVTSDFIKFVYDERNFLFYVRSCMKTEIAKSQLDEAQKKLDDFAELLKKSQISKDFLSKKLNEAHSHINKLEQKIKVICEKQRWLIIFQLPKVQHNQYYIPCSNGNYNYNENPYFIPRKNNGDYVNEGEIVCDYYSGNKLFSSVKAPKTGCIVLRDKLEDYVEDNSIIGIIYMPEDDIIAVKDCLEKQNKIWCPHS